MADQGYTYGNVLPLKRDNATGMLSFAVPQMFQSLGRGMLDLVNMRTAPSGQPGVNTLTPDALNALTMLPAGGMAAAERGAVGMFGGRLAATADHAAIARAEEMAAKGADRGAIWNETGWFQGPDKQWRFEIDDADARYRPGGLRSQVEATGVSPDTIRRQGYQGQLPQVLDHPALYDAFPALRDHVWQSVPESRVGNAGGHQDGMTLRINDQLSPMLETGKSITLHETQHAIQDIEGFAKGGSPEMFARGPMFDSRARDLAADLSKHLTGGVTFKPDDIAASVKYGDKAEIAAIAARHGFASTDAALQFLAQEDAKRTPLGQYRRLAGEVEARNVQTRMNFPPSERRARAPWTTADVPEADQILRSRSPGYPLAWQQQEQKQQHPGGGWY